MRNLNTLWDLLIRIDSYVNTTNYKSAVVLAFNTFILSGIIIQYKELINQVADIYSLRIIAAIVVISIVFISLISIIFVLLVIKPFLESYPTNTKKSLFYFNDIQKRGSSQDYIKSISKRSKKSLGVDVSEQIYSISKGLNKKYKRMIIAINLVIWGSLPLSMLYLILIVISNL